MPKLDKMHHLEVLTISKQSYGTKCKNISRHKSKSHEAQKNHKYVMVDVILPSVMEIVDLDGDLFFSGDEFVFDAPTEVTDDFELDL